MTAFLLLPRFPHAPRGWWRYSNLVWWQLIGTAVLAGYWWLAVAGVTRSRGAAAVLLALVSTVAALGQLGYGATLAAQARRNGCW